MELYVIVPLLSLVGAGVGSFLGAYLKKKGENLATHEDINKLVEQVSAVTQATKEIESKISDEVWGRQRQWEMKRDALFALAEAKSAVENALIHLNTVFGSGPTQAATESSKEALQAWAQADAAFDAALTRVSLVCGQELNRQLQSFDLFIKTAARDIGARDSSDGSVFPKRVPEFVQERVALNAAIRKELGVDRALASPP